jgi:hypothetical protein
MKNLVIILAVLFVSCEKQEVEPRTEVEEKAQMEIVFTEACFECRFYKVEIAHGKQVDPFFDKMEMRRDVSNLMRTYYGEVRIPIYENPEMVTFYFWETDNMVHVLEVPIVNIVTRVNESEMNRIYKLLQ